MTRAVALGLLLAGASCAVPHGPDGVPRGEGPLIGVYRAAIDDGSGVKRNARILLWAELPDRIHAELLSPVGGVRFVLDAGGGAACVVDIASGTAYTGEAGPGAFESLVGVRASIDDAVAALLSGTSPPGLRIDRVGGPGGALPERFVLADGLRTLTLTRLRYERGSAGAPPIGTGAPPPHMTVRPIEELPPRMAAAGGGDGTS